MTDANDSPSNREAHNSSSDWETFVFGDEPPRSDQASALAALLTSDNQGTAVVLQVTTTLAVACATYLTATVAVLAGRSIDVSLLLLVVLPAPVLLIQMLQMILGASGVRRSLSSDVHERRLKRLSGYDQEKLDFLGSRLTTSVTDPRHMEDGPTRPARFAASLIPYYGLYGLGFLYTVFLLGWAFSKADGTGQVFLVILTAATYAVLWGILMVVAAVSFNKPDVPSGSTPQAP